MQPCHCLQQFPRRCLAAALCLTRIAIGVAARAIEGADAAGLAEQVLRCLGVELRVAGTGWQLADTTPWALGWLGM